jgi:hypothetical protein
MPSSSIVNTINKVVEQAQGRYNDYIESEYIASDVMIDGVATRGQVKDQTNSYTLKEENTKMMTCGLNINVHRGSYIQMKEKTTDTEYKVTGIVTTIPNKTPVDWYFYALLFNTTVIRYREDTQYNTDGDVVSDNPIIIDNIDCFVQRVGMRERTVDAGIDRNSVNQLITTKKWDIQIDDILHIGKDKYIVTDIEELDNDLLSLYMTYYRG